MSSSTINLSAFPTRRPYMMPANAFSDDVQSPVHKPAINTAVKMSPAAQQEQWQQQPQQRQSHLRPVPAQGYMPDQHQPMTPQNQAEMTAVEAALQREENIGTCVAACLETYFANLRGTSPTKSLHAKLIAEVEKPLISHVLRYVKGNQLRAAEILGINRNTLRRKMLALGIEKEEQHGMYAGLHVV